MNCPICGSPLICWFNHKAISRRYNKESGGYVGNLNWHCAVCHEWFWSADGELQYPGRAAIIEDFKMVYRTRCR